MKKLLEGLRHFQEKVLWERKELFDRAIQGQHPQALLITCSDSRVLPETLLQADPGDLFVSRNAGNLVPPPETPGGEAATIEYAVSTLGVADIIVCGHYRCGAVKALLDDANPGEQSPVRSWLAHAKKTRSVMEREFSHLDGEARWDRAVEENVLVQIEHLSRHPTVANGLAAGTLRLHAWVLRFETGEVAAFEPQARQFVPLLELSDSDLVFPLPEEPAHVACACQATESRVPAFEYLATSGPANWLSLFKCDLPASLVVFAVALPLCVAIAKTCGMSTAAGIITAGIGGILVGVLGGGPLQVSGPTASLIATVMVVGDRLGLAALGVVVLLAGLIQIAAGLLRLGQWFRAVSPAIVIGLLAGIGTVLFAQQVHVTVDDTPTRSALQNLVRIPVGFEYVLDGHNGHPEHMLAALVGLGTLCILVLWKPLAPKQLQAIPAVVAAVAAATALTTLLELPIERVTFDGITSGIKPWSLAEFQVLLSDVVVWQLAMTIALVASAETLLTAAAVDGMQTGTRTRYDRELVAQGIGNALCGVLGALPMASVIVRSSANVQAGAKSRWSTVLHGVWMLAFMLLGAWLLRLIPAAALAAVLVFTSIRLIQFRAIRELWRESWGEATICLSVAITVVGLDLLAGVIVGLLLSLGKLIYTLSRLRVRIAGDPASGRMTLVLAGAATFLRLPKLAAALEKTMPGIVIHIDHSGLNYIDHACLTLLMNWKKQHEATGGKFILDSDKLRARFHRAHRRVRGSAAKPNRIVVDTVRS